MSCEVKTICVDLTGAIVNLTLPVGIESNIRFRFSHSTVGYTYVAKIINKSTFEVIADFTVTTDEVNNRIVLTLAEGDSDTLPKVSSWYLAQTNAANAPSIIVKGSITAVQVTDLTV